MNTIELTAIGNADVATTSVSTWKDWMGIVASVGCAIHCAAMPFVIAYLPALGLSFLADEAFHKWMALVCFLIAIVAFIPGLRKHGNWLPVSIGTFGLVFITFAAFGLAGECCPSCAAAQSAVPNESVAVAACDCEVCQTEATSRPVQGSSAVSNPKTIGEKTLLSKLAPWITPFGGLLLVSAHLLNRKFGCSCGCCSQESDVCSV